MCVASERFRRSSKTARAQSSAAWSPSRDHLFCSLNGGFLMSITPNPNLQALTDAGVAIWLDSLKRSWLTEGTLEAWRDEYVLHGVTTNPAIFGAAFASDEYDSE